MQFTFSNKARLFLFVDLQDSCPTILAPPEK